MDARATPAADPNLPTMETEKPMAQEAEVALKELFFLKETIKINKGHLDMEDYALNLVLNQSLIHIKGRVKNPWLRDPLKCRTLFAVRDGRLQLDFESGYLHDKLCGHFNEGVDFFKDLEAEFVRVLNDPTRCFNLFHKYKHGYPKSLVHAIVVFVLFLEKYLKRRHVVFVAEFITIFGAYLTEAKPEQEKMNIFLIKSLLLSKSPRVVDDAEQRFVVIRGGALDSASFQPKFLGELFANFLVGHDFLLDN